MFRGHPAGVVVRRLPRLLLGLVFMATGVSTMVLAGLGLGPWDVLHQGLAERTGLGLGTIVIVVGVVVMLAWLPLHERVGIGTLLNAVLIGVFVNLELGHISAPSALGVRIVLMLLGPVCIGIGSGLYIGTDLGPGPRDGVMTGLVDRGLPTWAVRAAIELTALAVGWAMGGTVGIGTIWFAVSVGPLVHFFLHHLSLEPYEPETIIGAE